MNGGCGAGLVKWRSLPTLGGKQRRACAALPAQSTTSWHEPVQSCCWSGAERLPLVVDQKGQRPTEARASALLAGEIFHSQARAALRGVRHDGVAAMNLRDRAEFDGERQLHRGAFGQFQVWGFHDYAVSAQIVGLANAACTAWHRHIDGGFRAMAGV